MIVAIRHVARGHQRALGQRDTDARCLRADHRLALLTRGLVTVLAMRTRVVRCEERTDDELSSFQRCDRAASLFDNATVLVPHRHGSRRCLNASVGPQIGPADACDRQADDRVRWFDDCWFRAVLEPDVARAV